MSAQPPRSVFGNGERPGLGNRSTRRAKADPDSAVRETDNDASIARFSAVSKNFITDQFARFFVPANQPTTRPPWVNIGTHHRTYVIDGLVDQFIKGVKGPKQVLSLGSGSDSRYWRLKHTWGDAWPVDRWVETDFKETVTRKIRTISENKPLQEVCGDQIKLSTDGLSESSSGSNPPTELHAKDYNLISLDLRHSDQLLHKLHILPSDPHPSLDRACPTLIIAELVFLYMAPEHTQACLKELASIFQGPLMVITYEALNLNDNFSKMMVQNLSSRGLSLLGFEHNCSVESQIRRFEELGFREIVSTEMKKLREARGTDGAWKQRWETELGRIKRLEFLDEVEELELVLQHYALTWALRDDHSHPKSVINDFYLPRFS